MANRFFKRTSPAGFATQADVSTRAG